MESGQIPLPPGISPNSQMAGPPVPSFVTKSCGAMGPSVPRSSSAPEAEVDALSPIVALNMEDYGALDSPFRAPRHMFGSYHVP